LAATDAFLPIALAASAHHPQKKSGGLPDFLSKLNDGRDQLK
jgi:hypothetical protein